MNFIVIDKETSIPLYGIALLKDFNRKKKNLVGKIFSIPAEAWIAFLELRYSNIPEVKAYLDAVENGGGINPWQDGHPLLDAVDERLEIGIEEFRHAMASCGPEAKEWLGEDDEGEEWKRHE